MQYQVYVNQHTDKFLRSVSREDESMASCIGRIIREYAVKNSGVIDAETINISTVLRDLK